AALGARVPVETVRTGASAASVEAVFDFSDGALHDVLAPILDENGIEYDGQLILRREINASGRGTARVNGRAVPLASLSALGAVLVDIHGQSDHLSILRRDRQLDALDRYGNLMELRSRVTDALRDFGQARGELEAAAAGQRDAEQRVDLLRFQVNEIESARLHTGEEDDLLAERNLLINAERLTQLSQLAREALQDGALQSIVEAVSALQDLAAIDSALLPLDERVQSAQYELEDVANELRLYADRIEFDPARSSAVEERLDLLTRLRRKYGATVEEVIAFGEAARVELDSIENLDERLADLNRRVQETEAQAGQLAQELSSARAMAAEALTESMSAALHGLGLKHAEFRVALSQTDSPDGIAVAAGGQQLAFTATGIDTVAFLVSFNPGQELKPLERVASGGETSRFLLALKGVLAGADRTPTLVFDEVDVGIGGRHGTVVGERLRELASNHQVLSITHLPQVAALGEDHISVVKAVRNGHTTVEARKLEPADRIVEIAEMMSGSGTEIARRSAAELLESARRVG
ncbi:MAG TPA: DNA repair protein RecN, partial [Chloroflexota bacterium]